MKFCFPVFSIQEKHAVFSNQQRRVSITPVSGSKVIVNGVPVFKRIELQHLVCFIICIGIISYYMHMNHKEIHHAVHFQIWIRKLICVNYQVEFWFSVNLPLLRSDEGSTRPGLEQHLPVHWLPFGALRRGLESLWLWLLPVWAGRGRGLPHSVSVWRSRPSYVWGLDLNELKLHFFIIQYYCIIYILL